MNFKMRGIGKKAVLGEIIITFIATIVVIFILILFALVSAGVKTLSGEKARTDKEYNLKAQEYDSYFSSFEKLSNFRFLLNEKDENGKKLNGFDDAYDDAFGEVVKVWTPAPAYAQFPDTCYYYKYFPRKKVWVVSENKGESWISLNEVIDKKLIIIKVAEELQNKDFVQGKQYLSGLKGVNEC